MSYSRFAIGFSRHRKVSRLSDAAFRLWASAIDYSREQLTGGELDQLDLDALPRVPVGRKRSDAIAEIVAVGLWEEVDGAFVIHDFDDWQDSPDTVKIKRAAARERMRRVRESRSLAVRANTERTSPEVTLTTSSSSDLISESSSGSPALLALSEGSDRLPARPLRKQAKSVHVPLELPEDWAPPADYLAVLALKYSVPELRVAAELPEFRWYWRQGNGAGTRSTERGWVQRFGFSVERVAKSGALFAAPRPAVAPRSAVRPAAIGDDERARARNNLIDDAKAGRFGTRAKTRAESGENLGVLADDLEKWQRDKENKRLSEQMGGLVGGVGQ